MREILRILAATAALTTAAWSGPARADVAPPDSCTTLGQACNTAGPNYDEAGVCVASTCDHPTPDGSTSYACNLCMTQDAGSSSSSGGSSGSGSSSGSSSSGSGSSSGGGSGSSKSSCAMSPLARDGATGFGMLALGLGALALGRRRRS